MKILIKDETSPLKQVIVGTAELNGPIPDIKDAYDPKSAIHIAQGTYPKEDDMVAEMQSLVKVLEKYGATVHRPDIIKDCNQIFARDIAFVIEDYIFISNILPLRSKEFDAIRPILKGIPEEKRIYLPEDVHVEGGDVMPYKDHLFIGYYNRPDYPEHITARTNEQAVNFFKDFFPNKTVKGFNLRKSIQDPYQNALHLDCCFQTVGSNQCIIHKNGFLNTEEYIWLLEFFGEENCFQTTKQEMFDMNCNVFSIRKDVVVSDTSFIRLNQWFESNGINVEAINYQEVGKQGGLLRCTTLPLLREY